MKVRDLIKDTVWIPGSQDGNQPTVSVILPTFRRGSDGLFLKAARSVLNQTLRDLELIIIDDASTDGTAGQIDELMSSDPRVSCLRHPVNIGLPAISEYEAFVRSKGQYIAFAFDDFVFEPDALLDLYTHAQKHPDAVVHGYIEWFDSLGRVNQLGRTQDPHEMLIFINFLSNSSFLVPRTVLEEIGLYDPHIASSRLCDWDLWRRMLAKFPLQRVDVFIGREHGVSRPDSLGNTYPLNFEAMPEYFGIPRRDSLTVDAFPDFDPWSLPASCSAPLAAHIIAMRRFFQSKQWTSNLTFVGEAENHALFSPRQRVIGIVAYLDASLSLFFDGLRQMHPQEIVYIRPDIDNFHLRMLLLRCDAVILVRHLFDVHSQAVINLCRSARIPLYYFIDDNFVVLASKHAEFSEYTLRNISNVLRGFEEVFCGSRLLTDYFRMFSLHPHVSELRLCFDGERLEKLRRLRQETDQKRTRIGFIGGEFRERSLVENVIPALAKLNAAKTLAFYTRSKLGDFKVRSLPVEQVRFSPSFDEFLVTWRRLKLDIIVHAEGHTDNISYKNSNILLIAYYLGAVPIVGREEAFHELGEEEGVVKIDIGADAWEKAIKKTLDPGFRAEMFKRLAAYCTSFFSPQHNGAVINAILEKSRPTDMLTWANRVSQSTQFNYNSHHAVSVRGNTPEEVDRFAVEPPSDVQKLRDRAWYYEVRSRALEAQLSELVRARLLYRVSRLIGQGKRGDDSELHRDSKFVQRLVEVSGLFDPDFYRSTNPEVAQSDQSLLDHYLQVGGQEGRAPSREFDSRSYLDYNPDVAKAGMNPLVHFLCYGIIEGRPYRKMVDQLPPPRNIERPG